MFISFIFLLFRIICAFLLFFCFVSLIFSLFRFIFNFHIYKKGKKVVAVLEGYDYYIKRLEFYGYYFWWFPVVSFVTINGERVNIILNNDLFFPLYKRGKKIYIKYIKTGEDDYISSEVYFSGFSNKVFDLNIFFNYQGVVCDFKYIVKMIFLIILSIYFLFFKL